MAPRIELGPGLEIGYGSPLARLPDAIRLDAGTHFLLARNGRGKTTLLRTLAGTLRNVSGSFQTHGFTQYLPEDMRFDPELPVKTIFKAVLPGKRYGDAIVLAERIELDTRKPYGRLSTGNRRKTALIVAELAAKPDQPNILLLDEPFSGLDAYARSAFEEIWQRSSANVLRLVSCHPDYDGMRMPSAILIEGGNILHRSDDSQTWSGLKNLLN